MASMLPTSSIVVVDGNVFDPRQPYLLATLGNHTLEALAGGACKVDFDAASNRIFASISTHDRRGVLESSERHEKVLQNLGYAVVRWGQKVTFPMSALIGNATQSCILNECHGRALLGCADGTQLH